MTKKFFQNLTLVFSIVFIFVGCFASSGFSLQNAKQLDASTNPIGGDVNGTEPSGFPNPLIIAQNREVVISGQTQSKITQLNTVAKGPNNSIVSIESTGPIQYTAFKLLNPLRLIIDFPKMNKGDLQDQLVVNEGVIESIRSLYFHEAEVLRLEIVLAKAVEYDIQKPIKNKLVIYLQEAGSSEEQVQVAPPVAAPVEQAVGEVITRAPGPEISVVMGEVKVDPCEPMLSGDKERISLDFQGASIRNLLRIISDISGFNLILSSEVSGSGEKIHMRLLDVPWNVAFAAILKNSNLGVKCSGDNIIRVATLKMIALEEKAIVNANKRKREEEESSKLAEELITEVVQINYADTTELAKNLNDLMESQITGTGSSSGSRRGLITVDTRTNKLILTDIRENLDEMLDLVRILDIQTPQVMIEARIVEVNKQFTQQLGIQWGLNSSQPTNPTISGDFGSPFMVDLSPGGVPLPFFNASGIALGFSQFFPGIDLDIQLQALEKEGNARILSSPKVTTLDNKEARIKAGRKIPFETISEQGTRIEFIEAELSLTVTPHITSDDYIYMIIDATKNSAVESNVVPSQVDIQTKEAHTEVLVSNGDTTVLGGIYESEVIRNQQSVPFFSKLPILGALFRNQDDTDTVSELLIFITPTVVVKYEQPNL